MRARNKQYTIFLSLVAIIFLLAGPSPSVIQKKSECTYSDCTRKPLEGSKDGYCIFHKPDKTKEEVKSFKEDIKEMLGKKDYDFRGFVFPETIDFKRDFGTNVFEKQVYFRKAEFQEGAHFDEVKFQGNIDFWQAQFKGQATFTDAEFQGDALFWWVKFQGETGFWQAQFQEDAVFVKTEFQRLASFEGAQFKEDAHFEEAKFKQQTHFCSAEFQGDACFERAQFKEVSLTSFGEAQFQGNANFEKVEFQGDAYFERAQFQKYTYFGEAKFQKDANFREAAFRERAYISPQFIKGGALFADANLENISLTPLNLDKNAWIDLQGARLRNTEIKRKDVEGRIIQEQKKDFSDAKEIYLLLKNNFRTLGRYDDQSWAFQKEKEMERKSYFKNKNYLMWTWSKFLSLLYGYGERPERVIISATVIIMFFAFLFMNLGIKTSEEVELRHNIFRLKDVRWEDFWSCLYFSVVTFTTLGYGDFRPLKGRSRMVAAIEAFIGAFMMALFVYTFARAIGGR